MTRHATSGTGPPLRPFSADSIRDVAGRNTHVRKPHNGAEERGGDETPEQPKDDDDEKGGDEKGDETQGRASSVALRRRGAVRRADDVQHGRRRREEADAQGTRQNQDILMHCRATRNFAIQGVREEGHIMLYLIVYNPSASAQKQYENVTGFILCVLNHTLVVLSLTSPRRKDPKKLGRRGAR